MAVQLYNAGINNNRPPLRIERKFYLPPSKISLAYSLLRHVCRLDSEYPDEQVNSLYFDTADLDQHTRSLAGDFRKDKVRIRWYGDDNSLNGVWTAFLELKSREGFASTKQRLRLQVPAEKFAFYRLGDGIISRTLISDTLAKFGFFNGEPLQPVIKISFRRYRFNEVLTGQRVTLDCRIRSSMVIRGTGYGERELELPGAVIEVKGASMELPINLRRLKIMDLDWSRFSKYSSCINSHLEGPGTVGRLSPSGKIVQL